MGGGGGGVIPPPKGPKNPIPPQAEKLCPPSPILYFKIYFKPLKGKKNSAKAAKKISPFYFPLTPPPGPEILSPPRAGKSAPPPRNFFYPQPPQSLRPTAIYAPKETFVVW